jgi:hypothetical protein
MEKNKKQMKVVKDSIPFLLTNRKLDGDSNCDEDLYGFYHTEAEAIADAKDNIEEAMSVSDDAKSEEVMYVYKLVPVKVIRGTITVVEETP